MEKLQAEGNRKIKQIEQTQVALIESCAKMIARMFRSLNILIMFCHGKTEGNSTVRSGETLSAVSNCKKRALRL